MAGLGSGVELRSFSECFIMLRLWVTGMMRLVCLVWRCEDLVPWVYGWVGFCDLGAPVRVFSIWC